jgi:transcription antitermination factor NusG
MSSDVANDQWYALCTRPRFEKVVAGHLKSYGYEEYLPLYASKSHWSDRIKVIEKPLFPGYAFCKFDLHKTLPIPVLSGVLYIVGIAGVPVAISEVEVASMRQIVASALPCAPWPFIQAGQRVSVTRGSLAGIDGIVLGVKSHLRLIVSLPLLQRSVAVEVDRDCIEPIQLSTRAILNSFTKAYRAK